jgi:hypothetical protein
LFEWADEFEALRRRLGEVEERIDRRLEQRTSCRAEELDTVLDTQPSDSLRSPDEIAD